MNSSIEQRVMCQTLLSAIKICIEFALLGSL
jgi:hypothetical protein